jgi:hypothetical protein
MFGVVLFVGVMMVLGVGGAENHQCDINDCLSCSICCGAPAKGE